jgi:Tol biopolymer transport system component/tRNA A-37 threonylcarbamoyl transferase component Bud32
MTPRRWRQIESLYHAALERDPGSRALFLAEATDGDEELRREVESLLSQEGASLPELGTRDLLAPGILVGGYRLEATLGQGGMGVVYRALDTKLNRRVAVKFLADEVADAAARRRFQREAQMASSLNHPHIVTVHDAGEYAGRQYLVTELVDGGTLRDWARAQKRGWREIVELLVGVADGLAAAHEAAILHRDIKPANILVSKSGYAKLADFGLAKLAETSKPEAVTQTLASEPTRSGIVVGTMAYMSPEQASGRRVDARSDVFSLGVVLYELLASRRPFEGVTELETLQAIAHGTPPRLGPEIPLGLRTVVEKALEKEPAERYQSTREIVVDLRRLVRQSGDAAAPRMAPAASRRRWVWAALLPVLLLAAFLASWTLRPPESVEPLQAVPLNTLPGVQRYPSFSPDGNHVAFTWNGPKQDNTDIYVQQIGAGTPLRVTRDPKNDYNPVWSPDGRWIAFLRVQSEGRSELLLIPPLGGPERKLTEVRVRGVFVPAPYLAWCPDSECLVVTDSPRESKPLALFVVSRETGEKRQLTNPQSPAAGDAHPAVSPDGRWLVFRRCPSGIFSGELYRLPLGRGLTAAGQPKRLTQPTLDARYPAWMPNSKEIVFSARGHLWRMSITPEQTAVRLPFVGEDGIMPVVSRPQRGQPARLAYIRSFGDLNIWRIQTSAPGVAAASPPTPSIFSTRREGMPQLSPDGRRVAFFSDRTGPGGIWVADLDGANALQIASMGAYGTGYPHWSPDGSLVVFHSNAGGQADVYVVPATGGKLRNITSHPARDSFPTFSRDGQWIYFTSNRTGGDRTWRVPAAGGEAVQVTNELGYEPIESPDGAWLYYVQTVFTPGPLYRVPTSGRGMPTKILDGVVLGNFAVLDKGIYYIDRASGEEGVYWTDRASGETRLQYFEFATSKSRTVARNLGDVDGPIAVSAIGRTILFARVDSSIDDLMLVENFR